MSIDQTKPYALCILESAVPRGSRVPPDVTSTPCRGCDRPVLVSPSTRELMATIGVQPVCGRCAPAGPTIDVMTEAAVGDLREWERQDIERN